MNLQTYIHIYIYTRHIYIYIYIHIYIHKRLQMYVKKADEHTLKEKKWRENESKSIWDIEIYAIFSFTYIQDTYTYIYTCTNVYSCGSNKKTNTPWKRRNGAKTSRNTQTDIYLHICTYANMYKTQNNIHSYIKNSHT